MDRKFEYRGDLGVTPLPEVLATIHRYRVPGVVIVSREGRVRRILLDEGVVIFASSNEREVSLGMSLLRRGILTPELAREADTRRTRDGLRLGNVLLQMGVLTPEDLNRAVADQIREILWGPSTGIRARSSSRSASTLPLLSSASICPSRRRSSRASAGRPT